MPDDVKIRVGVEGAGQAQRDLKKIGAGANEVGAARSQQAAAMAQVSAASSAAASAEASATAALGDSANAARMTAEELDRLAEARARDTERMLGSASAQARARAQLALGGPIDPTTRRELELLAGGLQKAGKAQSAFNDSAKTALTGLLGRLSPEMASLANVAVDVAKGMGQASVALLGMIGAGAALGGIVWAYRKIAEVAEKAAEAIKREAQARLEAARGTTERQADMAETLESMAGLLGIAEEVTEKVDEMQAMRGIPRDVASFGFMAQAIGGLTPEQVEQVMGAWLVTGRQATLEPGKKKANRRAIEQLLKVDAEAAMRALPAKVKDVGLKEMGDAPMVRATPEERIAETAVRRVRGKYLGELTPEELVALEAMAAGQPVPKTVRRSFQQHYPNMSAEQYRHAIETRPLKRSERTIRDLREMLERELAEIRAGYPADAQPVTVTVNQTTVNIDHNFGQIPAFDPSGGRIDDVAQMVGGAQN